MKFNFNSLVFSVGIVASSFLAAFPAQALVTWNLTNVKFSDNATATGSFSYDATKNQYSNVNVTVTGSAYSKAFTSGDINSVFSSYNTLVLCSTGNTCSTGSDVLYLVSQDSFGNNGVSFETLLNTDPGTGFFTKYGLSGSTKIGESTGLVSQVVVPFNIPGGEGGVLLSGLLALGLMGKIKKSLSAVNDASSVKELV